MLFGGFCTSDLGKLSQFVASVVEQIVIWADWIDGYEEKKILKMKMLPLEF